MVSLFRAPLSFISCFIVAAAAVSAERPKHDGKVVLFGNLHAHFKLSDDIRNVGDEMMLIRAFEYAHSHGLDFLAITDHHKAIDSNHRILMTKTEYKQSLFDVEKDYNSGHAGKIIVIQANLMRL